MSGECEVCFEHCLDCTCNKKMKKLKNSGLIGCLNESGITSENYRDTKLDQDKSDTNMMQIKES